MYFNTKLSWVHLFVFSIIKTIILYFRIAFVKESNASECCVNTTDIWYQFNFTESPQIVTVAVHCMKPVRVYMMPYEGRRFQNIISYVQFSNCIMSVSDWDQLSVATDMRVIGVLKNSYLRETNNVSSELQETTNASNATCPGLETAVSFTYWNNENDSPKLEKLLSCAPVYNDMAEVTFQNLSWAHFPTKFMTLFPNLQSLELPYNNFTRPPEIFPWTNEELALPRNLSRTIYMAHHYSVAVNLDIEPNKYRRLFNLAYNKITNLTDFAFNGYLQMIDLKGNGMVNISEKVFQNVTGLQNLDLSNNSLSSLPGALLSGLFDLHSLDLSANKLAGALPDGLFNDITALRFLSLANNSLTALQPGLFSALRQLKVLHLEHNLLTTLETYTFPIDSVILEEVFFHNNPISKLPEFIFWIRNLKNVDFHSTEITFDNLSDFLKSMDINRLASSIIDSMSDTDVKDLKERAQRLRVINLSNCRISSMSLKDLTRETRVLILVLLQHFKFELTGNPLKCDCKILPLTSLINDFRTNGSVAQNEYYFHEWVCGYPQELQNRPLLGVKDQETYCLADDISNCPEECKCFRRSVTDNIIVDCRNLNLMSVHSNFPKGTLELWYSGNNITTIGTFSAIKRVQTLDLSFNRISEMSCDVFTQAWMLKDLRLQSNLLTYLPESIRGVNLQRIEMMHNNFHCDCNSLWMKHWILTNRHVIQHWNELSCSNKATGRKLTDVDDSDFICIEKFDTVRDVIVPSVTCSVVLLFVLITGVVIYAYRMECKVLMYVYLGVHPFDRDADPSEEYLDCVIVHSGATTDWVMNNIVHILEGNDYRFVVCDMARDFVVGFSMHDNLSGMVRHSKRIIFCMSNDWGLSNETFKLAWNISQEKIKETRMNYGIVVNHGVEAEHVTDKDLIRLMKRGKFINSDERLFVEKVVYSMPMKDLTKHNAGTRHDAYTLHETKNIRHIPQSFIETTDDLINDSEPSSPGIHMHKSHAFISYSNEDVDYVVNNLKPLLESQGYKLCIADRDFIPGAPKEENILAAIHSSKRTLFILSRGHILDEWSLFTFRAACEKSLREKSNHLIVIIRDEEETREEITIDKEVEHYLKTYVSLNVNDRWFEQKLFNGMPLLKHSKQLHTSPLFATCVEMENDGFQENG